MMTNNDGAGLWTWCAILLVWTSVAAAQENTVFDQVAFEQRLNEQLPRSLQFRDHVGQAVSLDQFFGEKPVILSLVYYECPMLCTLELNGLLRTLKSLEMTAGDDFTVLTVSFDPGETPELAATKRRSYLQRYDRPKAHGGWHFLTGNQDNITKLCEAVGFRYVYDSERDEYAHASGIIVLTPEGTIARYFYGIDFPAKDLRLGLVEASAGTIGTATDQLLLLCYGYDPTTGKYGFLVMNAIRLGGLATVLVLAGFVGVMLLRERRSARHHAGPPTARDLAVEPRSDRRGLRV